MPDLRPHPFRLAQPEPGSTLTILTSQRARTSSLTSRGPSIVTCMPGSSQAASKVGRMLLIQVARMSTPRTASRAVGTGSTSMPSFSDISRANASRSVCVGLYTLARRTGRTAANASR